MKSSSVRGTPINSIKASNTQGMMAGKPKGMSGTVNRQFEGTQDMNRENGATGTPYNSHDGNGPETRITRSRGLYGDVSSGVHGLDLNNTSSTGDGIILDGITRETGYTPMPSDAMDSPVPRGAPAFDTRTIRQENLAHLGQGIGAVPAQAGDDILAIDGVMSRGMLGTSSPEGGMFELTEDDVLTNKGEGGVFGPGQENKPARREAEAKEMPKAMQTPYHPPK